MKRSTDRILTTHAGSLPRPPELIEMIQARQAGAPADPKFGESVRAAVIDVVQKQAEAGIDIVSDGEMGKPSFFHYVRDRLAGFEGVVESSRPTWASMRSSRATRPGATRGASRGTPFSNRPECIGPLTWKDKLALQTDIDNFKAALGKVDVEEAFVPCASVGIIAQRMANAYYPTYEAYVRQSPRSCATSTRPIADAGFVVQIDAPEMCIDRALPEFRDQPISAISQAPASSGSKR